MQNNHRKTFERYNVKYTKNVKIQRKKTKCQRKKI